MRIVIAPDSFKGSLSAANAAQAIAVGFQRVVPQAEIILLPLADGGEGTVEALVNATRGRMVRTPATDPLGGKIYTFFGLLGDGETAVVEMAAASGLTLIPEQLLDPMVTTTFGTGELIGAALDAGCTRLILGVGGSGTNDGGIGAIQALGGSFRDEFGEEVGFGGRELSRIHSIDLTNLEPRIKDVEITVACDVDNPLTGLHGASEVFGPQKGATPDMVHRLDAGMRHFAEAIRRSGLRDVESVPGAGAAGGLGAAAMAFLGAKMRPGIEIVLEATRFEEQIDGADLVITGEGRVDSQTLRGKVIVGILLAAKTREIPVLVLAGSVEPGGYELLERGAIAVLPIVNKPMPLEEAQERAAELLSHAAEQAARLLTSQPG